MIAPHALPLSELTRSLVILPCWHQRPDPCLVATQPSKSSPSSHGLPQMHRQPPPRLKSFSLSWLISSTAQHHHRQGEPLSTCIVLLCKRLFWGRKEGFCPHSCPSCSSLHTNCRGPPSVVARPCSCVSRSAAVINPIIALICRGIPDGDECMPAKVIVFSQWTRMLDLIQVALQASNIRFSRLDGTMGVSARGHAVAAFTVSINHQHHDI